MARSERFELPTLGFEVRCSIQLSYERIGGTLARKAAKASPGIPRGGIFPGLFNGLGLFAPNSANPEARLPAAGTKPPSDLLRWVIIKSFWRKP